MTPISSTGKSRVNNRAGYTLPELLVTCIVLTVMSGALLAAIWPALQEAHLRAVTSMVVGQLQYARSYAISNRTPTAVFFDSTHLGVGVVSAGTDSSETTAAANAGSTTNWKPVTTPAGCFQLLTHGVSISDVSLTDTVYAVATKQLISSSQSIYTPVAMSSVTPVVNGSGDEGQLITFSALGQGEDARITLQDVHGGTRVILVNALTGRCDLADNNNNVQTTRTNP